MEDKNLFTPAEDKKAAAEGYIRRSVDALIQLAEALTGLRDAVQKDPNALMSEGAFNTLQLLPFPFLRLLQASILRHDVRTVMFLKGFQEILSGVDASLLEEFKDGLALLDRVRKVLPEIPAKHIQLTIDDGSSHRVTVETCAYPDGSSEKIDVNHWFGIGKFVVSIPRNRTAFDAVSSGIPTSTREIAARLEIEFGLADKTPGTGD